MQRFVIFTFFSILFTISCTKDKIEEQLVVCDEAVTYENEIRSILVNSCAYAGCHDGIARAGNYNVYEGLEFDATNSSGNSIYDRTVERTDMPPGNVPLGKPTSLTVEEIELIKCWAENGYKKN
jgi:uncharacterized membrane protein